MRNILYYLGKIQDTRKNTGKRYKLTSILPLVILLYGAGPTSIADVYRFGKEVMKIKTYNLKDEKRNRDIPIAIYTPNNNATNLSTVIFSPGYQGQKELNQTGAKLAYQNYTYLAEYFTAKNYAFISIQHDVPGDIDGLESIDPLANQHDARKHLYSRGEENINFTIRKLSRQFPHFNFDKFIIVGHSNGGDIARFFACNAPQQISYLITFDARRCHIETNQKLKILMFEATDTSTDKGVIPDEGTQDNPKRANLEWVIVKPLRAFHKSYKDDHITNEIKDKVYKMLDWFLSCIS